MTVKGYIGYYNLYDIFNQNNSFLNPDSYSIGEGMEYPVIILKNKINAIGYEISTLDNRPLKDFNKIIFFDFPKSLKILRELFNRNSDLYLVINESELIHKQNWKTAYHKFFKKIFTWNDDIVDDKKFIKFCWPNKIPDSFKIDRNRSRKLCTLISGNKINYHKNELYSERLKTIDWFEKNHPNEFDFYGMGWDKGTLRYSFWKLGKVIAAFKIVNKILCKIPIIKNVFLKNFKTYKGKVHSKFKTLSEYKFSICYENAKNINGYITEKIFDSFFAGCVPIYWGPPNIMDFIPENTFIDRRKFSTLDELYNFIKDMDDEKYFKYLDSIESFINSDEAKKFSAENFSETLIKELFINNA